MRSVMFLVLAVLMTQLGITSAPAQSQWVLKGKKDHLARLPDAMLLTGYPPNILYLTKGDRTLTLQEDGDRVGSLLPSMTANGAAVASGRYMGDLSRFFAITRSVAETDGKWVDHRAFQFSRGQIALSADGSMLASVAFDGPGLWHIQVLGLQTAEVTASPTLHDEPVSEISWSPDGRHIAFELQAEDRRLLVIDHLTKRYPQRTNISAVYIYDLESGAYTKTGLGHSPSWSPSGEWIAFVGYVPGKPGSGAGWCYSGECYKPGADDVSVMRPDGTGTRSLMKFNTYVRGVAPVWSPDSKTLLINKSRNAELGSYDIYFFDLARNKGKRRFKNTMPVYAWGEAP